MLAVASRASPAAADHIGDLVVLVRVSRNGATVPDGRSVPAAAGT